MFCALWIPHFWLQAALRFRPEGWEKPVAVVDQDGVVEMTAPAREAGVAYGMSPAQALARRMDLVLLSRSPEQEERLSQMLLAIGSRASAYLEQTLPSACTLDLQGLWERIGPDPQAWGRGLVEEGRAQGFLCFAGIAANPDLALLAAQAASGEEPVRWVRNSHDFLAPLPLEVLSPSPRLYEILKSWGIHRLGELGRLKRHEVVQRLGPEGGELWDQATGRSSRVLQLVRPREEFSESFDFEHELDTAQPLLFLLRRFLEQLSVRLRSFGYVAASMHLRMPLSDGSVYERLFQIPSPTAEVEVLYRILETHFDGLLLEFAPVGVRLHLDGVKPEHQQYRLFANALRDPNRFAETLGRVLALVGEGCAGTPQLRETYRPDCFEMVTPGFGNLSGRAKPAAAVGRAYGLPLRRFRPPVEVTVTVAEEGPSGVSSPVVRGRVGRAFGPYRLSGEWWETGWETEEWDVELVEGGLYRISRQGERWVVEGCYEAPVPSGETGRRRG